MGQSGRVEQPWRRINQGICVCEGRLSRLRGRAVLLPVFARVVVADASPNRTSFPAALAFSLVTAQLLLGLLHPRLKKTHCINFALVRVSRATWVLPLNSYLLQYLRNINLRIEVFIFHSRHKATGSACDERRKGGLVQATPYTQAV
jgi:hypothetical protein